MYTKRGPDPPQESHIEKNSHKSWESCHHPRRTGTLAPWEALCNTHCSRHTHHRRPSDNWNTYLWDLATTHCPDVQDIVVPTWYMWVSVLASVHSPIRGANSFPFTSPREERANSRRWFVASRLPWTSICVNTRGVDVSREHFIVRTTEGGRDWIWGYSHNIYIPTPPSPSPLIHAYQLPGFDNGEDSLHGLSIRETLKVNKRQRTPADTHMERMWSHHQPVIIIANSTQFLICVHVCECESTW